MAKLLLILFVAAVTSSSVYVNEVQVTPPLEWMAEHPPHEGIMPRMVMQVYNRGGRIVGGESAIPGQIPFQVSLEQFGFHVCGGSIYNKDYIITAASCVFGDDPAYYRIVAGTTVLSQTEGAHVHPVSDIIIHPAFESKTLENDIALLKLNTSIDLTANDSVGTVALPAQNATTPEGTRCVASGWGKTFAGSSSNVLQRVSLPVISDTVCQNSYDNINTVAASTICAGYDAGGGDACQGDSGGPLVVEGTSTLVGIVSWGHGCGLPGYPGVYTEVSHYVDWIKALAD